MHRRWRGILLFVCVLGLLVALYIRTHPQVFNESFWQHAHCIKIAGLQLHAYAGEHHGRFPYSPRGYGNALLLLDEDIYFSLTGPGYDPTPFHDAKRNGTDLAEADCGRVYIQGLTLKSNAEIALLFDKIPTLGGDHCSFPFRLTAPPGREVWFVGLSHGFILKAPGLSSPRSKWNCWSRRGLPAKKRSDFTSLGNNPLVLRDGVPSERCYPI
jgi:hypothetical protein